MENEISVNELIEELKLKIDNAIDSSITREWHNEFSYNTDAMVIFTTKVFGASYYIGMCNKPVQLIVEVMNVNGIDSSLPDEMSKILNDIATQYNYYTYTVPALPENNVPLQGVKYTRVEVNIQTPTVMGTFTPDGIYERTAFSLEIRFKYGEDIIVFDDSSIYIDNTLLEYVFDWSYGNNHSFDSVVLKGDLRQNVRLNNISESITVSFRVAKYNTLHKKLYDELYQNKTYTLKLNNGITTRTIHVFLASLTDKLIYGDILKATATFVGGNLWQQENQL